MGEQIGGEGVGRCLGQECKDAEHGAACEQRWVEDERVWAEM